MFVYLCARLPSLISLQPGDLVSQRHGLCVCVCVCQAHERTDVWVDRSAVAATSMCSHFVRSGFLPVSAPIVCDRCVVKYVFVFCVLSLSFFFLAQEMNFLETDHLAHHLVFSQPSVRRRRTENSCLEDRQAGSSHSAAAGET